MLVRVRLALLVAICAPFACKSVGGSQSQVLDDGPSNSAASGNGPAMLTQHNDNARSGANLQETILKPANVNQSTFGKLYSRPTQGRIFAQPLYIPNVSINGTPTNVVIVATMHNMVYAFNADDTSANAAPLWVAPTANFGNPVPYTLYADPVNQGVCRDVGPEVGIISTPVVDPNTQTLYIVAKADSTGAADHSGIGFWLHALDLTTGVDKQPAVQLQGTAPGSWTDATGNTVPGPVTFDALWLLNRPGLLLANGKLFMGFGSTCDHGSWRGWILGYDATTFTQTGAFISTPDGKADNEATITDASGATHLEYSQTVVPQLGGKGGVWQGGMGLAADDQSVYTEIGNGDVGTKDNTGTTPDYGKNLGNSFVRLAQADLSVQDWFTPYNAAWMNLRDFDLGSTGPMLLPAGLGGKSMVIGGGKQGQLYLLDSANMGQMQVASVLATLNEPGDAHINTAEDQQILQKFEVTNNRLPGPWFFNIHGSPIFWQGPTGPMLYVWGEQDPLKAYLFQGGKFGDLTGNAGVPAATGGILQPKGMPGGMLSISANGAQDGIVWATHLADSASAQDSLQDGFVVAYQADPQNGQLVELWASNQNQTRDDVGSPGKFAPPTIANGKVFVVSNGYDYVEKDYLTDETTMLQVYGLLPAAGNNAAPAAPNASAAPNAAVPADPAPAAAPAPATNN